MNEVVVLSKPRSLASELEFLRPAFPSVLFNGEDWQRLLDRATTVPASLIENTFGFELRLSQSEQTVDFCVTMQAGSDKATEFLDFPQVEDYDDLTEPETDPHSDSIAIQPRISTKKTLTNLFSEMSRAGSFAYDAVPAHSIILEYDVLETRRQQNPAPGIFFGLHEHIGPEHMKEVAQLLDLASNSVQTPPTTSPRDDLSSVGYSAKEVRNARLRTIAEAALPYGRISQVGTFVSRGSLDFRVLIRIQDGQTIGEFLRAAGWTGNIAMIMAIVSSLDFKDIDFGVALDVAPDRIGAKIGLEVTTQAGRVGTKIAVWRPVIDALVKNGWCWEHKAKGLRQWCGYMPLFGPKMHFLLKGINHFKIGIENSEFLGVKAYLGARRVLAQDLGLR